MKAVDGRPWYRLHLATWAAMAVTLAVLILIAVPVRVSPGVYMLSWSYHYEHGWPFVCLDRFVWQVSPWDVDERNEFLQSQGLRWASWGDMFWIEPSNWPLSGRCFPRWKGLVLDLVVALAITGSIASTWEWSRRRLWRYRLRGLFVLVFLLSVIMAWWRSASVQCAREEGMVDALLRRGFTPDESCVAPVCLCRLVGSRHFPWLVVGIDGPLEPPDSATSHLDHVSATLALAKDFRNLERVGLYVADNQTMELLAALSANLEQLHGSDGLRELELGGTEVTDAGLKHLKGIANLECVALHDTQVTDAGLEHLRGLTTLENLDLTNTHVTDEGIEELRKALPNCEIVWEEQSGQSCPPPRPTLTKTNSTPYAADFVSAFAPG